MNEVPKRIDENEPYFSFETRLDSVTIWSSPEGLKVEITDGTRDAYYTLKPENVRGLNVLFELPPEQELRVSLQQLLDANRGEELVSKIISTFSSDHLWISSDFWEDLGGSKE